MRIVLIARYDDPHAPLIEDSLVRTGGTLVGRLEFGRASSDYKARWDRGGFVIETPGSRIDNAVIAGADVVLCLPFGVNNPDLVTVSAELPDDGALAFATREWNEFLKSARLDWEDRSSRWITGFNALTLQGRKLFLLQKAIDVGLSVPRSVAGNLLTRDHLESLVRPLAKSINRWQEIAPSRYFNTTALTREHVRRIADECLLAPSYVQEEVSPCEEFRIYVVGSECLVVAAHRVEDGPVDIRVAKPRAVVASMTRDVDRNHSAGVRPHHAG